MSDPNFIPDDAFVPDAVTAEALPASLAPEASPKLASKDFIPEDKFIADDEKYGTLGQQAITALEGAASAATFGLSTGAEKLLGVKEEDIRGRREENPMSHMVGQGLGLAATALIPGAGEAAAAKVINPLSAQSVLTGLGAKAAKALGPTGETLAASIAQHGIKAAAETALFQGGDEISKMLTNDPNQSMQTAAVNVGLAGLLGAGVGGAVGSVSPLWKAAEETKVGEFIGDFKNRIGEYLNPEGTPVLRNELAITDPLTHAVEEIPTKLSQGAKFADTLVEKGLLKKFTSEGMAAGVGASIGKMTGVGGTIGALVGERALTPFFESIMPSLTKAVVEGAPSAEGLKAATSYAMNVIKGFEISTKAAAAVFDDDEVVPKKLMPTSEQLTKLNEKVEKLGADPSDLFEVGGKIGHYYPGHATSIGQTTANAVNYLNAERPKKNKLSPLDIETEPGQAKKAAYERTLGIAQQPLVVMEHVKNGTLILKDIMDLNSLYPELYSGLRTKTMSSMVDHLSKGGTIPYKKRVGLSMFLQQPLDSTLLPDAVASIQMNFANQAPPPQPGMPKPTAASAKAMSKANVLSQTPNQARQISKLND